MIWFTLQEKEQFAMCKLLAKVLNLLYMYDSLLELAGNY